MNTIRVNLINSFPLTKLSPKPALYISDKQDSLFINKLVTPDWPYAVYKDGLLQDFWTVLSSLI